MCKDLMYKKPYVKISIEPEAGSKSESEISVTSKHHTLMLHVVLFLLSLSLLCLLDTHRFPILVLLHP